MSLRLASALVAILLLSSGSRASAEQKGHPRLVDVSSTRCESCHEELIRGRSTVHSPVADDCSDCHDVVISEEGTRITLTEPEPALCVSCHDDIEAAANGDLEVSHEPVTDSCLYCHDAHASTIPRLLISPVEQLCTECHDLSELLEPHGGQLTPKVNCLRCHLPHGSPNQHMVTGARLHPPFADGDCSSCHRPPFGERVRLRSRGERVCTSCHGDIIEKAGSEDPVQTASQHAAVKATRSQEGCVSCHDPHMSSSDRLLVKAGPALCGKCHGSIVKGATAETGHEAASDDCTSCHEPHRADQPSLLAESLPDLCLDCHDAEDPDLVKAHLNAEMGSLECTSCHTPHGDGNPKLLAGTVHEPVLDGCDLCHQSSASDLIEDGESALCLECHDDIGAFAKEAAVPHDAMEVGRCADCHNPHASPQDFLVKASGGGACIECHDDKGAGDDEFAHGAIALLGCRACHLPHGGQNPRLLRRVGAGLCLACHDARGRIDNGDQTVRVLDRFDIPVGAAQSMASLKLSADGQRNHPVTGHRVMGLATEEELKRIETTFEGELTCLACHDPHKGRTQNLLLGDVTSSMSLCLGCHPK